MEKQTDVNVCPLPGWETVRVLGAGSFGRVYEIRQKDGFGGDYRSALKVLSIPHTPDEYGSYAEEGYDDASITAMFRSQVEDITSEFKLMMKLRGHSNIVSCEEQRIVEHEDGRGWDILIRMELLTPLLDRCRAQELSEADVVRLGADICSALELCEKNDIIHRDIKPQNIFINEFGSYKLGDFGIAKACDHTTRATKTGTYSYMAPEVYRALPYNAKVDIYSLGMVLYWLLNERRGPFLPLPPDIPLNKDVVLSQERRFTGEALPPPAHGSDALKKAVLKACAFDPAERYATPELFKQALLAVKDPEPDLDPDKTVVELEKKRTSTAGHGKRTALLTVFGAVLLLSVYLALKLTNALPRRDAVTISTPDAAAATETIQPETDEQAPAEPTPTASVDESVEYLTAYTAYKEYNEYLSQPDSDMLLSGMWEGGAMMAEVTAERTLKLYVTDEALQDGYTISPTKGPKEPFWWFMLNFKGGMNLCIELQGGMASDLDGIVYSNGSSPETQSPWIESFTHELKGNEFCFELTVKEDCPLSLRDLSSISLNVGTSVAGIFDSFSIPALSA